MKKKYLLLIVFILTITFTGCETADNINSIKSMQEKIALNDKLMKEAAQERNDLKQENSELKNKITNYEDGATSIGEYFLYFAGIFITFTILNLISKFIFRG